MKQQDLTKCDISQYNKQAEAHEGRKPEGTLLHWRSAHRLHPEQIPKREVMQMWKEKVIQALRVLLIAALVMYLLTTKAC